MADAYLLIENGPGAGQYDLQADTTTIGRDAGEILIRNEYVSHLHARVTRDGDAYYLTDLGSKNKTYLNGQRVESKPLRLRDGDSIDLAHVCHLLFRCPAEAPPAPAERSDAEPTRGTTCEVVAAVEVDSGSGSSSESDASKSPPTIESLEARLAALRDITRELGRSLALDEVLPKVLDSLFRIFRHADRGFIVLLNAEGQLVVRWSKASEQRLGEPIKFSHTIVQRVMESRQAELRRDALRDLTPTSDSIRAEGIRSVICAPLLEATGKAIGVIELDTKDPRKHFRLDDLNILASVAGQAGMAIERAQFHELLLRRQEGEKLAEEVQLALLPRARPNIAGYGFFDYYKPAEYIGGDYYDYIPLPDGRLAVVVADVMGGGVPAAMLMARVSGEAKFCLATEPQPAAALMRLNDVICRLKVERFVTVSIVILDPVRHTATIVNAGHPPPIWRRGDGRIEEPGSDESGIPVGLLDGYQYLETVLALRPGESLVMYTDGCFEAMDPAGQRFSRDRIRSHVRTGASRVEDVGQAIIDDLLQFVGDRQHDDICLVCLGRHG